MILPIYAYGHPVLRKETKDIDADYPNLKKLIEDMYETMYHAKGMGLAAPQIGKDIRLFIVDTEQLSDEDMEGGEEGIRQVFINADIIEEGGKEWPYEEGC
ncbi:MAG: peptide deformylase, partial [Saprospiraceae bacterium]|nr:peptide deformylase [Saprospiraceae bacterium]